MELETTFKVKDVIDEDFVNYKKCSMFIATSICNFKCEHEDNEISCQNSKIVKQKTIEVKIDELINRFDKSMSKAIVFGGLEPFDQFKELISFIVKFRSTKHKQDIVIYTGYTEEEICKIKLNDKNIFDIIGDYFLSPIIIKFGRYKSNLPKRHDDILGVTLISDNQYAKIF